jgi:hypothetical protein
MNLEFLKYCDENNTKEAIRIINNSKSIYNRIFKKYTLDFNGALLIASKNYNYELFAYLLSSYSNIDTITLIQILEILCSKNHSNKEKCIHLLISSRPILKIVRIENVFKILIRNGDYQVFHYLSYLNRVSDYNSLLKYACQYNYNNIIIRLYNICNGNISLQNFEECILLFVNGANYDMFTLFMSKIPVISVDLYIRLLNFAITLDIDTRILDYIFTLTGYIENLEQNILIHYVNLSIKLDKPLILEYLLPNIKEHYIIKINNTYYLYNYSYNYITDRCLNIINKYCNSIIECSLYIGDEICSICLENGGELHKINCGHPFHIQCIFNWYKKCTLTNNKFSCPLCKLIF